MNGWQRAWIVLSVLYAAFVILMVGAEWPQREDVYRAWFRDVVRAFNTYEPELAIIYPDEFKSRYYPDLSEQQIVEKATAAARTRLTAGEKTGPFI